MGKSSKFQFERKKNHGKKEFLTEDPEIIIGDTLEISAFACEVHENALVINIACGDQQLTDLNYEAVTSRRRTSETS
ncbi:hypothetical protein [uncultured Desulfuromusa sp.]|uniref:hypothetical protein n=1 Tax=uncultured Desulfuromusa sp. TaxID=219183 RepID=UPI002AA76287|nr:hypothetical protein [uncultured Desulfuromusa sp.]